MARKTEQAIKVSATWTPSETKARIMSGQVFGNGSPLDIRGGRLTINAAIAIDMADPAQMTQVAQRISELRADLEATGTLHTFGTQAGAVPVGTAYRVMTEDEAEDVRNYGTDDGERV